MSLVDERQGSVNGHRSDASLTIAALGSATTDRPSLAVIRLSVLVGLLGLVIAGAGLLWQGSGEAFSVTTLRGQSAEIYGRGLYQNDTLFSVGNNRGSDAVTLILGIPLLAASLILYAKGSLRGRFVLLGTLGFFLYIGASYALGSVAYNEMFLVYVALFAASLFAFVTTFMTFDAETLRHAFSTVPPRRLAGIFMIASSVATLVIWLIDPVTSLVSGDPPKGLDTHTTLFTHALDMAVIVPATFLAGVMLLRGRPFGYVVAFSLLILEALLMPMIIIATIVQVELGIDFEPGEIIGPIAGFSVLALFCVWVIIALLRRVASRQEASQKMMPS